MNEVLKKLKLTTQNPVLIINAPEEYKDIMKDIESEIHTEINGKYKFIQLFAKSIAEAKEYIGACTEALDGDGYLWVCYPKGTSKKYKKSDLNRDTTYQVTEPYNFQGVTLVSIDNDWSAFRIRHNDNIKSTNK
jgi:superoxide dismutase